MPVRQTPQTTISRIKEFHLQKPQAEQSLERVFSIEPWLFCGGEETRKHDTVQRVRPTSILGQLRFFWRLLARAEDLTVLKEVEARIFGAASQSAPFRIEARTLAIGRKITIPGINDPGGYLSFPARSLGDVGAAEISTGVQFRLFLQGNLHPELVRAFDLWTILGGVGGRTRRGLGAVQVLPSPFSSRETLAAKLKDLLKDVPRHAKCQGTVRSIADIWLTAQDFRNPADCLFALERWYKSYRQHRRPGSQTKRPGRSFWDEPELIRNLTNRRDPRHQRLNLPQGEHAQGWARSVMGLPIVFQFPKNGGDPPQTMLQGQKEDRFASALLFRPVVLENGRTVGVVTLLSEPYLPPRGLVLKEGRRTNPVPATQEIERVWEDLFQSRQALALTRIL